MAGINLFGFQIVRNQPEQKNVQPQITAPIADDGAINVNSGGYYGTYLDLESSFKNNS